MLYLQENITWVFSLNQCINTKCYIFKSRICVRKLSYFLYKVVATNFFRLIISTFQLLVLFLQLYIFSILFFYQ